MTIVFVTHPSFLTSQSMPRFAKMLADGMIARGHKVETWTPEPFLHNIKFLRKFNKWLGYIDQYIIYRSYIAWKIGKYPRNTLFVIVDQALGPFIPLVADRKHVIHCHDFLAQKSALGLIPENKTKWSGVQYQKFIRKGYSKGSTFISVSAKTQNDLQEYHQGSIKRSYVVYNGVSKKYYPVDKEYARSLLRNVLPQSCSNGYILHVGGNQWYKNRLGVIEIYNRFRELYMSKIPLVLIGAAPSNNIYNAYLNSPFKEDIIILPDLSDRDVRMAYCGASVFLFPSISEGFGWPIAEAMACGTLVITTSEDPMLEVAGDAGFLIPKRPVTSSLVEGWAMQCSEVINHVLSLSIHDYHTHLEKGYNNIKRFNEEQALDKIEDIYLTILSNTP